MGFFDKFKKNKPANTDAQRIENLRQNGRITDGTIFEIETLDTGEEVAHYYYSVQGVDYQSPEILSAAQLAAGAKYAEGAKVGVRYDPRNHGNSILD